VLRHHAPVLDDADPGPGQALGRAVVADAELEPDDSRAPRQGEDLLGVAGQVLGAAEDLDDVDRLREVGERGDHGDPEEPLPGDRGVHRQDPVPLLEEVGRIDKPCVLKRGMSATIEEWLLSAEYIMGKGNKQVILCERGIRTFETATRNTLDLSSIPVVKKISHLPIICDPSHATGKWYLVPPMTFAALGAGADGLLIEVHPDPDHALSDGAQSLTLENFSALMKKITPLVNLLKQNMNF